MKIKTNLPDMNASNQEMEYYKEFLNQSVGNLHIVTDFKPLLITDKKNAQNLVRLNLKHERQIQQSIQVTFFSTVDVYSTILHLDDTQIQTLCIETLGEFSLYAKRILELKGIPTIKTTIREWQAIDDTSCKQCILELTIKTDAQKALSVWDELSEELAKFINLKQEDLRSFLKEKLTLDIRWS